MKDTQRKLKVTEGLLHKCKGEKCKKLKKLTIIKKQAATGASTGATGASGATGPMRSTGSTGVGSTGVDQAKHILQNELNDFTKKFGSTGHVETHVKNEENAFNAIDNEFANLAKGYVTGATGMVEEFDKKEIKFLKRQLEESNKREKTAKVKMQKI